MVSGYGAIPPSGLTCCVPQATLNHTKEDWIEVMEMQAVSPHLRLMLGEGIVVITSEGKVWWRVSRDMG